MTLHPPIWQQNNAYPANLDRQMAHLVIATPGVGGPWADGFGASSPDLKATQRALGANMSVDVAAGRAVILGTDVSDQGKYLVWSDALVNVPIAAAPGAGQERIDLVVAQVRDAAVIGGANNDWILTAVTGTAAAIGSAVEPTPPASSLTLARILVQANVTQILNADITDRRKRVALLLHPERAKGFKAFFLSGGVSSVFSSTTATVTDFVINNVTVSNERNYRVHLSSTLAFTTSPELWRIRFRVNGVDTLLLDAIDVVSGVSEAKTNVSGLWIPSSSATVNVDVTVQRMSGVSGTLQFIATAGSDDRWLWIEDAGPRLPIAGL